MLRSSGTVIQLSFPFNFVIKFSIYKIGDDMQHFDLETRQCVVKYFINGRNSVRAIIHLLPSAKNHDATIQFQNTG